MFFENDGQSAAVYEPIDNRIGVSPAGIRIDSPIDRMLVVHESIHAVHDIDRELYSRAETECFAHKELKIPLVELCAKYASHAPVPMPISQASLVAQYGDETAAWVMVLVVSAEPAP